MTALFYLRRLCVICTLLVLLSACGSPSNAKNTLAPTSSASPLTIVSQQKTTPVPTSFVGMNIELVDVCALLRTDAAHPQTYEQLFKNFGSSTLHIGGHSADEGLWQPDAKSACLTHPVVTKSLVRSLFAFARRIHWNVIWGLNFLIDNPQMQADEAAYVTSVGGDILLGFTLGNEPELFAKHGERPAGWAYNNYLSEWKANRDAVLVQVPNARFFGPEACCQTAWFSLFLHDESGSGLLAAASRHYYYNSGAAALAAKLTAETLLSPLAMQKFTLAAREWVAQADNVGLPVDITEINSISDGGVRGISDTFGATLWTSDILFESTQLGIHQVDFQQVPGAAYAFINNQGKPQMVYYGLLFFQLAAAQSVLLPSVLRTSQNVSAYVLKGPDGTLRVVVINKEPHHSIQIAISPGASYHTMTTFRMQAGSLTATNGITLGNTTLSENGSWQMPTLPNEPVAAQTVLNVPASSATLFTFSA